MELPEWWVFLAVALTVFIGCLVLNYVVNRLNESRLEQRLIALQLKSPAGRVTQVHVPDLETGEATQPKFAVPVIKQSDYSQEMRVLHRGKNNIPVSESEVERIISKPIFLGSIYRSSEMIVTGPSSGDIGEIEQKRNEPDEYYYKDILSTLLDRVMGIVDMNKSLADFKLEYGNSNDEFLYSEVITLNAEIKSEIISDSVIMNDILDQVMVNVNINKND